MARDTSPTERRGYERPPIGDDWADAWDGLVEDSDELAVERGPIADRPSTGAYDDALYLAVDQRTLWRWDAAASDWEAAAGLGTASDPVPGTSHFESLSTDQATINELALVAEMTTNHSVPNNTPETLILDNIVFEDSNVVDADTSSGEITVQQGGGFVISAMGHWLSDSGWSVGDGAGIRVVAGGSIIAENDDRKRDTNDEARPIPARLVNLSANDVISLDAFQASGSSKDIQGVGRRTYLTVYRLRS